jgi:CBS domain-containing protein
MKQRVKEMLQKNELFRVLPEEVIDELIVASSLVSFPKHHFVIHEREQEHDLFFLIEGMARNLIITDEGEEVSVRFYHPGELAGLINALAEDTSRFSVQTMEDSHFLVIKKSTFNQLVHDYSLFSEHLTHDISKRLQHMYHALALETSAHHHGFETYPYRKKVGELMDTAIFSLPPSASVVEAASVMLQEKVSSILIMEGETLQGIITERDLISLIPNAQTITSLSVSDVMSRHLITIAEDAYFYEAMLTMMKHKVKHLPVLTHRKVSGIVTLKKLTDFRGHSVLSMVKDMDEARTVEQLAEQHQKIVAFIARMMQEGASAHEICSIITEFNDRILRRIIELSEQAMIEEGWGPPPTDYCWITMGSEGRKEQTLSTDQDNGLIYPDIEDKAHHAEVDSYFSRLAEKIVAALETCGFPRCKGDVMATNPKWRKSLSDWKHMVNAWFSHMQGEEIRMFTIFLDFRPVYGQSELAHELRRYFLTRKKDFPFIYNLLAEDDASCGVPLGMFGRIIYDKKIKDSIDIKGGALVHFVNAMRLLAIFEGIEVVSTIERLELLTSRLVFTKEEEDEIKDSFNTLLHFRIRENMRQLKQNLPLSNELHVTALPKEEQIRLKKALHTAKWLQQKLIRQFQVRGIRI